MTTRKQLNLRYAFNVPVPLSLYDDDAARLVLLPSDHPTPDATYADFEFELDYEDTTREMQVPDNFKQPWMKFFIPPGFVPPPPPSSPTDETAFPRVFWERAKSKCIEVPVTTRTWFWKQVGTAHNIHSCFYNTDYNYGDELLEQLNDGLKRGRYIVNQTGDQIIRSSCLLKRCVAEGGGFFPKRGDVILINNVEHSYESIFG
jgi:hypothetical protein